MTSIEHVELAPGYRIPRIVRGGWQLAGGHGPVDRERAMSEIARFVDAGLDTADGADIDAHVESIYGDFNLRRVVEGGTPLQVHTQCVPDVDGPAPFDAAAIRTLVERSCERLQTERLDLVQLHWKNVAVPGMVEAALALAALQRDGRIRLVGGTNFGVAETRALLDAGVPLASLQVRYSLLDRRPEQGPRGGLVATGVPLLCYGTVAGGFLAERWLGEAEPAIEALAETGNRALVRSKRVIDAWGGWSAFQSLLEALQAIGARHGGASIATVATRWVLDRPGVAAAVVGSRYADHLDETLAVFALRLDAHDHALLQPILAASQELDPAA